MTFLTNLFAAVVAWLARRAARKRIRIDAAPMPDERSSIETFRRIHRPG